MIFYRIRSILSIKTLLDLYHAMVYPNLTYCISIWGATGKTNIKCLEIAQKRIVRAIMGVSKSTPSSPLFNYLGILNIRQIYSYMCGIYVHKSLKNPEYNVFELQNSGGYRTRAIEQGLLGVPRTNLERSRQSIRYAGPVIYNGIPLSIRSNDSSDTFKRLYKIHLRRIET